MKKEFITSMSTKKNLEENALLEVLDEELAQFSGGGLVDGVPVAGPLVGGLLQPVTAPVGQLLNGTKLHASVGLDTPIASVGAHVKTAPGLGDTLLGSV